jgi:hypothetical protein
MGSIRAASIILFRQSITVVPGVRPLACGGEVAVVVVAVIGPMTSYVDLYQANPGRILDQTEPFPSLLGLKSGQTGPTGH